MAKSQKLLLDPARAIGRWEFIKLEKSPPAGHRRFKVICIEKETVLAYCIKFEKISIWVPKSTVAVGMHPSGYYYCADIPEYIVKRNNLIALA